MAGAGFAPCSRNRNRPRVPLHLYEMADRRGGPIMAKGRGESYALRLVRLLVALLAIPDPKTATPTGLPYCPRNGSGTMCAGRTA